MKKIKEARSALLHMLFPVVCQGCGSDLVGQHSLLCFRCMAALPSTDFEKHTGNPVEKRFYGRLPLAHASAAYYFSKDSLIQQLIHQVKYKGNKELCHQLGVMMGTAIKKAGRFDADLLIPLPLFPARQRKRGFNQATILCEGMAEQLSIPVADGVIIRPQATTTQTHKGRIERWQNMEGRFVLKDPGRIEGKHILLVDDVITTGATLEACGAELLKAKDTRLSVACFCVAGD